MKMFLQRRLINAMFIVALILLTVAGLIAYKQIERSRAANVLVIHTYKVITSADQISTALLDAEVRVNNYLITNDTKFVEGIDAPFEAALQNAVKAQQFTNDNSMQQERLKRLMELIKNRIALVRQIIEAYPKERTISLSLIEDRLKMTNESDQLIKEIQNDELSLLKKRNQAFNAISQTSNTVLIFTAFLAEFLFIVSMLFLNYYLRQRNIAEKNQAESEAFKTAVLEAASDSIITINRLKIIETCNQQTTQMFGYTEQELKNKSIGLLSSDLVERISDRKGAIEGVGVRKNGSQFPIEFTVSKMQLNDSLRFVFVIRDITERKKVEVMKDEFISVVSHELRTPLTSIRGSLGLLIGGAVGPFSEEAQHMLEIADNNSERLLVLINDILDMERIESGKMTFIPSVVDVTTLVKEAIAINRNYGDRYGVTIKLIQTVPDAKIFVDPARMQQVLANLISNAAKFSPKGQQIDVDITKEGNTIRISISDSGPGFPKEFESRIFQKFSQADASDTRVKSGTGLGLSISKAIVEQMGGTLKFHCIPNQRTTFYTEFPMWYANENHSSANKL